MPAVAHGGSVPFAYFAGVVSDFSTNRLWFAVPLNCTVNCMEKDKQMKFQHRSTSKLHFRANNVYPGHGTE